MSRREITCQESDTLRECLVITSGLTDVDAGIYSRTWGTDDGHAVLQDEQDGDRPCQHWDLRG